MDFTARDGSGVCNTDLLIDGRATATDKTTDLRRDTASFTQCWASDTVTGTLDTDGYSNGPLKISYLARNAANVISARSETLRVDNTPVTLGLSAPGDPDPDVWVNHAVRVNAAASAGPSGLGGTDCTTNKGARYGYPSGGITVNGTGVWTVACSSWNNAVDVNGQAARSPLESVAVHIDETPPRLAFEPVNPLDPQAVSVATSDAQSGVASGEIQIRPSNGGGWLSLATEFGGTHLIARFDDAALAPGRWVIRVISCDHAGNCSSTQETLRLPLRVGSVLTAGFQKAADRSRGGRNCSRLRTGSRRHQDRKRSACDRLRALAARERVAFGTRAQLHGRLTTVQGVAIARATISILTAPSNGLGQYRKIASSRTNSHGTWTAALPAGPSRLIVAAYSGSSTIQPVQRWARLIVPASVRVVRVWPRHVPWGGQVHVEARLLGGYLPPGGALVRLRLGYRNAKITYGVKEHVGGTGAFEVTNTFGPGPAGVVRKYWLQECTLPEADYPFAPACGPRDAVVVG